MSLEDQYDAWVRGLMGGGKYAANEQQAEAASDAVQQMQAQLEALSAAQKRQSAASSALGAVQKAGAATAENVRKMSSELTKSLKQDGLLGGTVLRRMPRVHISTSVSANSGAMERSIRSSPVVGPWK